MPVTVDQPAPYAPASAIMDLVSRHRAKGLQAPVDADVLARCGISDSLIPRTLQALKVLDLINPEGHPTEVLEGIRLAPESEYQARLTDWLTAAYADALAYVDPSTADEITIRDAFRKYVPTGQQSRMVTLFMGLFTAAGVMPERQRATTPRKALSNGSALKPRPARATPAPASQARIQAATGSMRRQQVDGGTALPPALSGLLASLPPSGAGWTKELRDKFMAAFPVILDFCYPIRAEEDAARPSISDDELLG